MAVASVPGLAHDAATAPESGGGAAAAYHREEEVVQEGGSGMENDKAGRG